jgi:hypothetical protein
MKQLSTVLTIALLFGALASAQSPAPIPILNPNVATEPDLLVLPHLSPTLVKGLIARRPYKTMLEVNAQLSPALSKEQLSELYVRLFLPIASTRRRETRSCSYLAWVPEWRTSLKSTAPTPRSSSFERKSGST